MLKIGIVGLPNVGKSTLFNALTKQEVLVANYPFATIDPSVGIVPVPDERLGKLAAFSASEKTVPAVIEFVDIAGLVKGASEGEGLGNQFLSNIRETDAILEMVRFFDDPDITHVHGDVDPVRDIEVINLELVLADREQVNKRLERLTRDVRAGNKDAVAEEAVLRKIEAVLSAGRLAREAVLAPEEAKLAKPLNLLTMKPILYALNGKSGGHNLDEMNDGRAAAAKSYIESIGGRYVLVDAHTERELNDVAEEDRDTFRQEFGVQVDGLEALIVGAYETLGLITFFTTGPKESRAWTIPRGATAPVAGAAIHNDFKDKFIRAEVVSADDLLAAGSYAAAREKGKVRTEGKEYVVKDGDVMVFLHSSRATLPSMEGRSGKRKNIRETPSRRDFLKTAATVTVGSAATAGAFEVAEMLRGHEGERSPEIVCEFGPLAGQPCYGLATEYFGFFGDRTFPERATENFQETYGRLWDRKAALSGSELMRARGELKKREYAELWRRGAEHKDAGNFIELVNLFAKTERNALEGFDWDMLGHYYGIRGDWELKMLKHLASRAHGQSLMAFSMTEIMPYGPDMAEYNIACYDALLTYAGSAFVEGIPALGDKLDSWGPFQHTAEHAIDAGIGRRRSLPLGPHDPLLERYADLRDPKRPNAIHISLIDMLSDETRIPRELDSFSGMKDHATAALLLGLDHVALAVRTLHREGDLDALERIDQGMDGAAFASVLAAHHYRPSVAYPVLLEWARAKGPEATYAELCRRRSPSVGTYAQRSAANFEAVKRYSDALLTLDN